MPVATRALYKAPSALGHQSRPRKTPPTSRRRAYTGATVDRRLGEAVEGLFTFIQSAIDRPAHLIRAQYDAAKGFPAEIDYDGAAQIADDEIFFRASDVHPITPPR
jgi:hypothetical protein